MIENVNLLYPRSTEGGKGVYWIHPDVCPSVRPSVCPSICPSVCRQGFRNFSRKLLAQFISSLGFILMGYVSGPLSIFVFVSAFLALWWPKIDRKSGFPQFFAKTVGSIHFIPGIYTYGVSLWTSIDFHVRALIFGPLVAKN